MISIKISGQFIDVPADLSIPFEVNNDLFNIDDTLPRQFTYQVTLPATPRNNEVFQWLKLVNSTTEWSSRYQAEIIYPGLNIIGMCKVNKTTVRGYEVTFFVGKSAFREAGEKLMNTLSLGGVRKIIDPYTNQDDIMAELLNIANAPEDHDFLFAPVMHENFYNGVANDENSGLASLLIINTFTGIVNYFKSGSFQKNWIEGTSPKPTIHEETTFVPYFKLQYIIKQIFAENNYVVDDSFFNTEEKSLLYIFNNFCLDKQESIPVPPIGTIFTTVCDNEITPGNHMPNNTVSEFLNGFCRMFNVHQDFKLTGQKVRLISREDIYNNLSEDNWTQKQNGPFEQTAPDRNQYGFSAGIDDADEYHVNVFIPFKTLERNNYSNRTIIDTPLSWPYNGFPTDPNDGSRSFLLAKVNQPGNSPLFPNLGVENPCIPKLMYYRGMKDDSLGNDYPYLTPTNLKQGGGTEGDLIMDWNDETFGIYKKFWERWINFISNARLISMPLRLTIEDIANLDLTKRKRIDTATYFIKKLSFNLTHRGIEGSKADLYKI